MGHRIIRFVAMASLFFSLATALAEGTYRSIQITLPKNEATIHDNEGKLDVAVALTPALDIVAGDRLQLLLDGKVAAQSETTTFSLTDLPRGTHTIEADVRDRAGDLLLHSTPVVVHMWRASRLFPNRAGR